MAPLVADPETARPYFRDLRSFATDWQKHSRAAMSSSELSMGMSNDYEVAVEEGATIVRLGSALLSST